MRSYFSNVSGGTLTIQVFTFSTLLSLANCNLLSIFSVVYFNTQRSFIISCFVIPNPKKYKIKQNCFNLYNLVNCSNPKYNLYTLMKYASSRCMNIHNMCTSFFFKIYRIWFGLVG